MIGRTLSSVYRISELVGSGGFADVYLGRDVRSNTVVAIKVLHPHFARDPQLVKRFLLEARTAQSLTEPHIVRVLDAGEDAGTFYIVMEYVQGHTLAHTVRTRGALPVQEAVGYARQILLALEAAHKAGIVHRDIKPQNIMVTPEGITKVMDFGIAKHAAAETMTQTGMYLGTPQYMSPEQARGEKVDARSDLYSLAIVLYEMLGGRPPFDAESPWQVLRMQTDQEPLPLSSLRSDIPPWLVQTVAKGLEKECSRRFQLAGDVLATLNLTTRPAARPPAAPSPMDMPHASQQTLPTSARPGKLHTTRRDFLLLTGGAGAAALGAFLFTQWPREPSGRESAGSPTTTTTISAQSAPTPTAPPVVPRTSTLTITPTSMPTATRVPIRTVTNSIPTATMTPLAAAAVPISPSDLLWSEDFESGAATSWSSFFSTWQVVVDETGNHLYRGTGPTNYPQTWLNRDWTDYVFEARVRVRNGTAFICTRADKNGTSFFYDVQMPDSGALALAKYAGGQYRVYRETGFPVRYNTWYVLRVEMRGAQYRLFADGGLVSADTDTGSPLLKGGIGFYMTGGCTVDVDDIRVWSLK